MLIMLLSVLIKGVNKCNLHLILDSGLNLLVKEWKERNEGRGAEGDNKKTTRNRGNKEGDMEGRKGDEGIL